MSHDKNDELRADKTSQDEHRQHERDDAFEKTGETFDAASQDERRHEGNEKH